MKKTGCIALGAIWFGAAVSVAEIEAGLQSGGNWPALILGHLLGGVLLFAAGLIGARTSCNAMVTTAAAFGSWGGRFFAALNVLQLVGWTAVMVSQGAAAIHTLSGVPVQWGCVGLAALVAIWLFVIAYDRFNLAAIGIALLAILAVVLTWRLAALPVVTGTAVDAAASAPLSFWAAFEISVAMPLSWLPLISDYTRTASRPLVGTATAVIVYTLVSIWMYSIGFLLARVGSDDLAAGITQAGLGVVGLVVVIFSTMTTTFLDAYSSGESMKAIFPRINAKVVGVLVCGFGADLAITGAVDRYVDFICLIASVFAPMAAVLIVSRYFVRNPSYAWNLLAWLAGTVTYHLATTSPLGPTLTALLVSVSLACLKR